MSRVSAPARPWVIGAFWDLLLLVATPLVIVPAIWGAKAVWSTPDVLLFVAAFGQTGHLLPGFLRAYGDRALFARFRTRFLVAPLLLGAVCVGAMIWNLHGLILLSLLWAVWHALMQTYGFARIYDAKAKSTDPVTAWIDFAMCVGWFGGALVLADKPLGLLLDHLYRSGGLELPAGWVSGFRFAWLVGLVAITGLFFVNLGWRTWRGDGPSPIKLVLLTISFGFYWFAYAITENVLVGAAMFEIFHDVQYMAIVWYFNHNRVRQDSGAGSVLRFLFRRGGGLLALYVAAIGAFGLLRYVEHGLDPNRVRDVMTGLLASFGLLHYYYDGFIWKVREAATAKPLLASPDPTIRSAEQERDRNREQGRESWTHLSKWSLAVIPFVYLTVCQLRSPRDEVGRYESLTRTLPTSADLRLSYADALEAAGRRQEAAAQLRHAVICNPRSAEALCRLGAVLLQSSQPARAERLLRAACDLAPDWFEPHNLLGVSLAKQGRWAEAETHFRRVTRLAPEYADGHANLSQAVMQRPPTN